LPAAIIGLDAQAATKGGNSLYTLRARIRLETERGEVGRAEMIQPAWK
jgi:predicted nucleotidyltransferase